MVNSYKLKTLLSEIGGKLLLKAKLLSGLACLALAPSLFAGPITVDAGWYGFCFEGTVGAPATAGCQNQGVGAEGNTFTFTAIGPVLLQITDAFLYGDRFSVVIDGGAPILTSLFGPGAANTGNPDTAFADADYSKLSLALGAGAHSVDIFVSQTVGTGAAYVQVITDDGSAIPEPGSMLLLGGGLAMIAFRRWRK